MRTSGPDVQHLAQAADTRSDHHAANLKRRRFLFTLGVGGAGAAVAVKALPEEAAQIVATSSDDASGYRETPHVRDYYRTTKV